MKSKWNQKDVKKHLLKYRGYGEDITLRTYTARLIGSESSLVLHGGGNTSVKTTLKDVTGEAIQCLCVKGSGWDLAIIEPEGHPAVKIAPLLKLKKLTSLSDEDMVNAQRINMLDAKGPTPSVETLLHAFLPHKFIDHTHADAILSIINNSQGEKAIKELTKGRLGLVPYIMPGFKLAKLAEKIYLKNPQVEGLVLLKHGLFTFGKTAKESYERMIYWVDKAERYLKQNKKQVWSSTGIKVKINNELAGRISNALRSALWIGVSDINNNKGDRHLETKKTMVIRFRSSKTILDFVSSKEAQTLSQVGPPTPDHIIRTKQYPLYLSVADAQIFSSPNFADLVHYELASYKKHYQNYVKDNSRKKNKRVMPLDPLPRIIIVPGLGIFSAAQTVKDADIALDIYEHTIKVIREASYLGTYQVLSESDLFDMEYWSLEQAKLGKAMPTSFEGRIVWVSGGASGIGLATAKAFYRRGANVFLIDIDKKNLERAVETFQSIKGFNSKTLHWATCDVTDEKQVRDSFDLCSKVFGGTDIVISNAGYAPSGEMDNLSDKELRKSFDVNFFSHQYVAKSASRVFKRQKLGGVLLFNASKSAFNQGPSFGPYATPKSAVISLMKQYAIEMGEYGIRSNAVNADRVLTGLFGDGLLEKRANARGLKIQDYLAGNLLKEEVFAEDVAEGFVYLASARKTTGAVLTIDGGNAAAFPR